MSHDLYASWATAELAQIFKANPLLCLNQSPTSTFEVFANRESGRNWPIPDGRISIDYNQSRFELALELKRENEGLHGILTAIGQSQAYIHPSKGYTASVIVIPDSYSTHNTPGGYIDSILSNVNPNLPIGVYSYSEPDTSLPSPFKNRLTCHRPVNMPTTNQILSNNPLASQKSQNQWAHLREGSSEPDAFFRYLQIAKTHVITSSVEPVTNLPSELIDAVNRINPNSEPLKFLSNSTQDHFHDRVWRNFWFKYILTDEVSKLFIKTGSTYLLNDVPTLIQHPSGNGMKKFFSGKSNSIKNVLVTKLSDGSISEIDAWQDFARNIRNRAHSYREDIDSGLEHLGFLESDGKPSELGYRFVDAVERNGHSFKGTPRLMFGAAILNNGSLNALLHYFYKLSELRLKANPLDFTTQDNGRIKFNSEDYLNWLKDELANNLKVMSTASLRQGGTRKPFQAELAILRQLDMVSNFRVGMGLEINWPLVQEYSDFKL